MLTQSAVKMIILTLIVSCTFIFPAPIKAVQCDCISGHSCDGSCFGTCPNCTCNGYCYEDPTNTPRPQATSTPRPANPTNTPAPPGTTPDPTSPPCVNETDCACGDSYNGSCWVCNSCNQPTSTPSPTSTPTPTPLPWYKLNSTSFHSNGTLSNSIPPQITPFDSSDTAESLLVIGGDSVGVVSADGTIDVSPGTVSQHAWSRAQYQKNGGFLNNLRGFIEYARARKKVSIISSLDEIQSNTVNIYERDLELSDIASDKKNFVLIVQGDIVIPDNQSHSFNPEKRSMAIIATGALSVHHMIGEVHGILIADTYDLAYGVVNSANPLKITGNLISHTALENTKRERTDRLIPSVYVIFDAQMYEDLIPHLSTILLQRRELE